VHRLVGAGPPEPPSEVLLRSRNADALAHPLDQRALRLFELHDSLAASPDIDRREEFRPGVARARALVAKLEVGMLEDRRHLIRGVRRHPLIHGSVLLDVSLRWILLS
jgi:hypothetical protein